MIHLFWVFLAPFKASVKYFTVAGCVAVDSNNRPNSRRRRVYIGDYWTADVSLLKYAFYKWSHICVLAAIEKWITRCNIPMINYWEKFIIFTYCTCVYRSCCTSNSNTEIVGCNKKPIVGLRPAILVVGHNRNWSLLVGCAYSSRGWKSKIRKLQSIQWLNNKNG